MAELKTTQLEALRERAQKYRNVERYQDLAEYGVSGYVGNRFGGPAGGAIGPAVPELFLNPRMHKRLGEFLKDIAALAAEQEQIEREVASGLPRRPLSEAIERHGYEALGALLNESRTDEELAHIDRTFTPDRFYGYSGFKRALAEELQRKAEHDRARRLAHNHTRRRLSPGDPDPEAGLPGRGGSSVKAPDDLYPSGFNLTGASPKAPEQPKLGRPRRFSPPRQAPTSHNSTLWNTDKYHSGLKESERENRYDSPQPPKVQSTAPAASGFGSSPFGGDSAPDVDRSSDRSSSRRRPYESWDEGTYNKPSLNLDSTEKIASAINDPRYKSDEGYRREVSGALARSPAARVKPLFG